MKENFVLRQEMQDRLQDPAASGPIDELIVLYRDTPEELEQAFRAFIGPITATGQPTG